VPAHARLGLDTVRRNVRRRRDQHEAARRCRHAHDFLPAALETRVASLRQQRVTAPAEPLLVVVPDGEGLEIEARMLNKDIGWVHEGQPVRVKLEAFPFTRYGVLQGTVVDVSNDAITDERLGLVYAARVKLAQTTLRVERRDVAMSPGMAVSAEIKTGTRRLIDYFLSPIQKHVDESLGER
jgi:hemolysin D